MFEKGQDVSPSGRTHLHTLTADVRSRFWMDLSGDGPLPVMHFGMNGMLMVRLTCIVQCLG
jgi:hypothetical protein